jgi:hypothetical protein
VSVLYGLCGRPLALGRCAQLLDHLRAPRHEPCRAGRALTLNAKALRGAYISPNKRHSSLGKHM